MIPSPRNILLSASLVLVAGSAASALDTELQGGGLNLNYDRKDAEYVARFELQNKQVDQGFVRNEDLTARLGGHARFYGFGLSLDTFFTVGEDKTAVTLTDDNPTTYAARPTTNGECTQVNFKVDYLLEFGGVYGDNEPFLQFAPHFETIVYPNQPAGPIKEGQKYAGFDLWLATPLKGVELGTSHDWSIGQPAYKGAVGLRQLYQNAPYDLSFWQVANFGDRHYHNFFTGSDHRGFTTLDLGAKVTTNLLWRETWGYVRTDWTYWLLQDDRDNLNLMGRDSGEVQVAVGIEWRAEVE